MESAECRPNLIVILANACPHPYKKDVFFPRGTRGVVMWRVEAGFIRVSLNPVRGVEDGHPVDVLVEAADLLPHPCEKLLIS